MRQKWTSGYGVRWTPIMTFERRRVQLLDWLEEETAPVSFHDDGKSVGVALVDPGLRLSISRRGMRLSSDAGDLPLDHLLGALAGVFEVMEPKGAVLDAASCLWTYDLGDVDYNEARASLASLTSGVAGPLDLGQPYRPIDTSMLVDFASPEAIVQAEWGIVDQSELLDRATDPHLGRLAAGLRPEHSSRLPEVVPEVALLADVFMRRRVGGLVSSAHEVMEAVREAEEICGGIADAIHMGHGKDAGEFAQIG